MRFFPRTLHRLAGARCRSVAFLAEFCGTDESHIRRMMSRERGPSEEMVLQLAFALVVDQELYRRFPDETKGTLKTLLEEWVLDGTGKLIAAQE